MIKLLLAVIFCFACVTLGVTYWRLEARTDQEEFEAKQALAQAWVDEVNAEDNVYRWAYRTKTQRTIYGYGGKVLYAPPKEGEVIICLIGC